MDSTKDTREHTDLEMHRLVPHNGRIGEGVDEAAALTRKSLRMCLMLLAGREAASPMYACRKHAKCFSRISRVE